MNHKHLASSVRVVRYHQLADKKQAETNLIERPPVWGAIKKPVVSLEWQTNSQGAHKPAWSDAEFQSLNSHEAQTPSIRVWGSDKSQS